MFPSLAFSGILKYLKITDSNVEIKKSSILLKNVLLPGRRELKNIQIPVDDKGQMMINYAGRWEETFKHASFASVLSEQNMDNKQENESAIQHLYNIMKVDCSNHWYSFEHRESVQSSVRGIIIRRLGKKLQ